MGTRRRPTFAALLSSFTLATPCFTAFFNETESSEIIVMLVITGEQRKREGIKTYTVCVWRRVKEGRKKLLEKSVFSRLCLSMRWQVDDPVLFPSMKMHPDPCLTTGLVKRLPLVHPLRFSWCWERDIFGLRNARPQSAIQSFNNVSVNILGESGGELETTGQEERIQRFCCRQSVSVWFFVFSCPTINSSGNTKVNWTVHLLMYRPFFDYSYKR